MKKLILLLILTSCASQTTCKLIRTEDFYGTKYAEYSCKDTRKFCKYDSDGRKINCFSTRQ